MRSLKLLALTIITLALSPCAFEAPEGGLASGGELQRVQEPETGEQVAQEAAEAQESGIEGSIADEAQDGGAVGAGSESITEPPTE